MKLTPIQVGLIAFAAVAALVGLVVVDRMTDERSRPYYRYGAVAVVLTALFLGVQLLARDHGLAVDITKGAIAIIASGAVFYEAYRVSVRRPLAEKWKRIVGVTLGVAAILAYFNGLRFGYSKVYHRWDQYHYYMGAKYFPELGYDGLYRCAVIAQQEIGTYTYTHEDTRRSLRIDMTKEVHHPDKKIRNLGGDNLLRSVKDILDKPEECTKLFTPERWKLFKDDVAFFRSVSDKGYWEDMQKDHGFNPPPVWTIAGKLFADRHPASTGYLQFLASLDIAYLAAMFVAIWWAFGWRVFAVAAVLWGCQSSAPYSWTGGAFLRQDWLFYLVFSACLLRKKYFALGAAALVYAGLLRIFPGLVVIGWLSVAGWQLWRKRTLTRPQWRMLAGGVAAAAILIPASIAICGPGSYKQFYEHTLQVHDTTPLTNHMGLRVLVGQKTPIEIRALGFGVGKDSGRMKYTKDGALTDPFEVWKDMRNARYERLKPLAYGIILLSLAFFVYVTRRVKNMWVALCLAQVFVILLSQLTCYYYTFLILGAMLTRVKPLRQPIELSLFGLAFLTQLAWRIFYWNDDKYWVLTLFSLLVCYGYLVAFAPRSLWHRIRTQLFGPPKSTPNTGGGAPSATAPS
ncbi:MAG: hypothetical protein R3F14_36970 [Polyangiaceae bacterium]